MTLRFGTGGVPLTSKDRSVVEGIKRIAELGLGNMELEFVYQTFIKEDQAKEVKKVALENDVILTVHGSYFINLASLEAEKIDASIDRIIEGARIGDQCGAKSITFHPAVFMGRDKDVVYSIVKDSFQKIFVKYREHDLKIKISPELTGKASQFGDLQSLIKLVEDFPNENIGFCFDFAHKHARDGGGWNSTEEFNKMLEEIRKSLGQEFLDDMHIHMSGINYSPKGERNHLTLLSSQEEYLENDVNVGSLTTYYQELGKKGKLEKPDINWKELIQALKQNNVGGVVVCESPNLEEDALLMQKFYEKLK